jgi:hypothetical protein
MKQQTVWTRLLGWRILCGMTLSARNRLEGKVVEIQARWVRMLKSITVVRVASQ